MLTIGVDDDAVDAKTEVQTETPKMPSPALWTIIIVVVNNREYDGYLKHDVYILTVKILGTNGCNEASREQQY